MVPPPPGRRICSEEIQPVNGEAGPLYNNSNGEETATNDIIRAPLSPKRFIYRWQLYLRPAVSCVKWSRATPVSEPVPFVCSTRRGGLPREATAVTHPTYVGRRADIPPSCALLTRRQTPVKAASGSYDQSSQDVVPTHRISFCVVESSEFGMKPRQLLCSSSDAAGSKRPCFLLLSETAPSIAWLQRVHVKFQRAFPHRGPVMDTPDITHSLCAPQRYVCRLFFAAYAAFDRR
jgi:hypothetical protein